MKSLRSNSRNANGKESDAAELVRLYNCSAAALNILYEAAEGGSYAAREKLHQVAEILLQAAGRYGNEL